MFIRDEEQRSAKGLADLLDYMALVEDGIVLTSTGVYLAGWEIAGPDMDAMPLEDSWQMADRIAGKLRLGAGWTVQCDQIRGEYREYCPEAQNWPDAVSALIDEERRERFLIEGEAVTRLSRYYLTLAYEPALQSNKRSARWVFSADDSERPGPSEKAQRFFTKNLTEVELLLRANLPGVRRLKSYSAPVGDTEQTFCELLRYIRRCVTAEDYPFAVPDTPMFLNQYLAAEDFTGGAEPELGDPLNEILPGKYIRVLSIDSFPAQSFAGIMREVDAVPFDFRFSQQGRLLEELEAKAEHEKAKGGWGGKKTTLGQKLKKTPPPHVDAVASEMENDAARAASLAEHGKEINMRYHGKILVVERDPERLRQAVEALARVVKFTCGFNCRLETVNAVAAWLGSLPGMQYKDRRKFIVTTQNFVHMMPLSAPWRGHRYNPSTKFFPPNTPPLFYAVTSGGTPYRFHPHVEDVGHQLVIGPTGSGKTVWLAFGISQFFRYENAQVFAFDKKRTLYTLTKAMGGEFYDISRDGETQLCPLQVLETPGDRAWAAQWIELLLEQNDLRVTPVIRNEISVAVEDLSCAPRRSLTDFQMAIANRDVKEALQFYLGGILDGERDGISMSRFCTFEMDELYRMDKRLMNGALFYIFSRIRRRLTSSVPTLVTVDEFREALEHPMAAKAFDDFLFEGRKLNMAVWVVIQELEKVLRSPLKGAVLQQCFTKVCLPNPQAILEAAEAYEQLGLNARDRGAIAHGHPKSHYYVATSEGKRMIALELGPLALSFLASSSDREREMVDRLMTQYGSAWPVSWLQQRGLQEWAARLAEATDSAAEEAAMYA